MCRIIKIVDSCRQWKPEETPPFEVSVGELRGEGPANVAGAEGGRGSGGRVYVKPHRITEVVGSRVRAKPEDAP